MNIPCKMILAAAVFGASSVGAFAQDAYYGNSQFEGVYAGAYAGGVFDNGTTAALGAVAGANFSITDGISAAAEIQGGAAFGNSTTYDALMLGHVGYEIDDMIMVYGAAGAGVVNGTNSYAIGGGAEAIVVEQVGVRGEILGLGAWGSGINATKATAGVLWHMR